MYIPAFWVGVWATISIIVFLVIGAIVCINYDIGCAQARNMEDDAYMDFLLSKAEFEAQAKKDSKKE